MVLKTVEDRWRIGGGGGGSGWRRWRIGGGILQCYLHPKTTTGSGSEKQKHKIQYMMDIMDVLLYYYTISVFSLVLVLNTYIGGI